MPGRSDTDMSETVLILRASAETQTTLCVPFSFRRPRIGFVKNLTEVKGHLLRCLKRGVPELPHSVMLDAGPNSHDFKSELNRWLERHPKLRRVRVVVPAELSWMARGWSAFGLWLGLW